MPRKDEILSELLARKTREIVARSGNYAAFLRTAARNYKYTFREQVLIHAQRPDATACAEIDIWNRLGRRVNRGATGIALLRDPSLSYRIRYVFDISDTNSRENRDISLWQMKPEYENEVIQALQDKFLLNRDGSFLDAVEILSRQLAEEAAGDCLPDLLNNKKDSFLEELDNNSIARWFKDAVSESVRYMVLHRCGYAPELDSDVSGCILDFNTEITASILGSAASTLSQSVLREIGVTVKSLERQQSRTFDSFGDTVYNEARKNDERSQNNGTDLQNAGRLPSTQPDSPGESQGGQVRDAAPQLPPQAPGGAVHRDADGGHAERPSGGGGPGGQPDAGAADNSDGPGAGRDGRTESPGSDAVGPADEQHPAGRRGDHLQSADLRVIEESPLPSVEEQVSFLDGGFSVPEEAQQAFFPQLQLPQQVIDEALCMGFNDRDSRKIICAYFMKDKPDNADFLQRSYGTNGAGLIIQDQEYAVWYDPEGIRISTGRTVQKLHTTLVTWEQAAKRIRELLDMGRYMPKEELEQVPAFERRRIAQSLAFAVRECSAQAKEAGYLPLTMEICSSNKGFPEIEAQMQRLLESPDTLKHLIDEWTLFAAAHANDRSPMVSRLYNPAELLQKLEDLQRIPLTFTAAEGFDSLRRYFISDDEINQALRGHESELQPSEQQKKIVASLSERAEKVRNKQVDSNEDNMLVITNDGRKLALDQRLINPMLPDSDTGKVAVCAENVYNIWERTAEKKSTQMVFVDLSTPHNDGQFNVYDDLKKKLLDKGIPESEIAYIHDAKTEAAKKELFGKVRSGEVRVLIGSTQKMGAGTNAQRKLIALHHMDCPWRPSDLQQREGRIIRQGNENPKVDIYTYVTENTFDSYLYQLVEGKQKFIGQIMTSKSPVRSAEDIDETALSYAEIKALCSGNPQIKEKMDLDIEVQKLKLLRSNHMSQRYALEDKLIHSFPMQIASTRQMIDGLRSDMVLLKENTHPNEDGFSPMVISGQTYTEKKAAGTAILEACNALTSADPVPLGSYRGFKLTLCFDSFEKLFKISMQGTLTYKVGLGTDVFGNIQRIDNLLESMPTRQLDYKEKLKNLEIQVENAKQEVAKPFPREEELKAKSARLDQLNILLNMDKRENEIVDGVQDEDEIQPQRESRDLER